MSGKAKRAPAPSSSPSRKEQPQRTPGPAKPRPRCLQGVDDEPGKDHPTWRLALLDLEHDGDWSWGLGEDALLKIVQFLRDMERLTWKEIWSQQTGGHRRRGAKHKFIPAGSLCTAAQNRLLERGLEEFDELFRFRLGNMERLWGVIHLGIFYPVWWDPGHKVCPSGDRD
jgi:hypothetical protein